MPERLAADVRTVESELQSLFPLISQRFQSFSEAADAALDVLSKQVPGEVVLGQIEPDEGMLRILDVRGATVVGVERGHMLPMAGVPAPRHNKDPDASPLAGVHPSEELDGEHLRSLGLAEWISLPLEMSDGSVAGLIAAMSRRQGDYRAEHVVLLGLAARMLAYEWERVQMRVQLRELHQRARDDGQTDGETGLPDRDGFVDLLDREWRLARRGTVESMVISCHVHAENENDDSPLALLALKDAAEVLTAAVRTTDHVGRTGRMDLGAILIGCEDERGVDALAGRFTDGLRRVTRARPVEISVSIGSQALGEAPSAVEALKLAEGAVRGHGGSAVGAEEVAR